MYIHKNNALGIACMNKIRKKKPGHVFLIQFVHITLICSGKDHYQKMNICWHILVWKR